MKKILSRYWTAFRSSITGLFVKKEEAIANPDTTYAVKRERKPANKATMKKVKRKK